MCVCVLDRWLVMPQAPSLLPSLRLRKRHRPSGWSSRWQSAQRYQAMTWCRQRAVYLSPKHPPKLSHPAGSPGQPHRPTPPPRSHPRGHNRALRTEAGKAAEFRRRPGSRITGDREGRCNTLTHLLKRRAMGPRRLGNHAHNVPPGYGNPL